MRGEKGKDKGKKDRQRKKEEAGQRSTSINDGRKQEPKERYPVVNSKRKYAPQFEKQITT